MTIVSKEKLKEDKDDLGLGMKSSIDIYHIKEVIILLTAYRAFLSGVENEDNYSALEWKTHDT